MSPLALSAATLAAAGIFTLWPGLDLRAAALLRDPATGGWLADALPLAGLRMVIWKAGEATILGLALLIALALVRRGAARVPARLWGFALLALVLGPGLLVNVLLKEHWGRARPRALAEFGGEAAFTPALQIADQCARNCSFVSGEAAMTATLALILWLVAAPRLRRWPRAALGAALLGLTMLSGFLRVADGGHFLSDVVFAAFLPALLTLLLWRATGAASAAPQLTVPALLADLGAPFRWLGRPN